MKNFIKLLVLSAIIATSASASVRFFPRAVYFDEGDSFRNIRIKNDSGNEMIYKLSFGYTMQRLDGGFVATDDSTYDPAIHRSYCENLSVFPKRIKIKSEKKQVIRITVKNKNKKYAPGEYYCRLYATSIPLPAPLSSNASGVTTALNTIIRVGAPLHFRVGNIAPDLSIEVFGNVVKNGVFYYKLDITNKSKMGFRGDILTEFFLDGDLVKVSHRLFAMQENKTSILKKTNVKDLAPGTYQVVVKLIDSDSVPRSFKVFGDGKDVQKFDLVIP